MLGQVDSFVYYDDFSKRDFKNWHRINIWIMSGYSGYDSVAIFMASRINFYIELGLDECIGSIY